MGKLNKVGTVLIPKKTIGWVFRKVFRRNWSINGGCSGNDAPLSSGIGYGIGE